MARWLHAITAASAVSADPTKPITPLAGDVSYNFLESTRWRVMPTGDSITLGVGSDGGYRCVLSSLFSESGIDHEFVGPLGDKCGGHAGFNGNTIKQIAEHLTLEVLTAADADIVALMAGTNDFFFYNGIPGDQDQLGANATGGLRRLENLLDALYDWKPSLVVALSTTTMINATLCAHYHEAPWHPSDCPSDMQDNLASYDKMLPALIERQWALSRLIYLHDVNAEAQWTYGDWSTWGIHFSAAGYQKMASSWFKALSPLAPKAATLV